MTSASLSVTVACPAKINLGLSILGRRPDGYHEIETVFQAIDWEDVLTVSPSEIESLRVSGPYAEGVPTDASNLVLKAISALRQSHPVPPLSLHLEKNVPHGSGLGGGSSDVAGALVAARRLFSIRIDDAELEAVAARVGSDTAFFVRGGTQWGRGRGEKLTPISANGQLALMVAVPPVSVSTREAYGALTISDWGEAFDPVAVEEWLKNPDTPPPYLGNAFERPVTRIHLEIASTLDWLRGSGALVAFLSGSGSACVGLFGTEQEAERVAARAPGDLRVCRVCRFVSGGVRVTVPP